ncbi:23S rRNA pseudouridine(2604) synthase RluF [Thalassotalea maritima]|uniref:23S rRNA pseudouridine(2604) synthase RluF n=1 Tax=Thalassotalea maritima TaxID=3242416 RepID=UPI0035283AE7
MSTEQGKRLNKFISDTGYCSRREADKLIEQQRVTINGKPPELGTKVLPSDEVRVNGKLINAVREDKSDRIYLAYNKPIGITCTTERKVKGNIVDAIGHKQRIFPIGRLDKPSEGLIFLTNDGDIVNKILRAENAHDKEYVVTVDKPISERFVKRMAQGVPILGTVTKPCQVDVVSKFVFKIILTQGLNRQIRRMCEYLGFEVTKLKRTRIMAVELGNLKPGQWRNLNAKEMQQINDAVAGSRKTSLRAEQNLGKEVKAAEKHSEQVSRQTANRSTKPNDKSSSRATGAKTTGKTSEADNNNSRKHAYKPDQKRTPKPRLTGKLTIKK